jgi:hypothetical protein
VILEEKADIQATIELKARNQQSCKEADTVSMKHLKKLISVNNEDLIYCTVIILLEHVC